MADWRDAVPPTPPQLPPDDPDRRAREAAKLEAAIKEAGSALETWLQQNEEAARRLLGSLPAFNNLEVARARNGVSFGHRAGDKDFEILLNQDGLVEVEFRNALTINKFVSAERATWFYARKVNNDPAAIRNIVAYVEEELNRFARRLR